MDWSSVGILALLLMCPLAMLVMMRGGHGHGHGRAGGTSHGDHVRHMSDEQLRETARRAEQELAQRRDVRSTLGGDVGTDKG